MSQPYGAAMSEDDLAAFMRIPSVSVNHAFLSVRGDQGYARLTFGEDNTPGQAVYQRVAVTMPLACLQALHNLIAGTLREMQAQQAAHQSGNLSSAKN